MMCACNVFIYAFVFKQVLVSCQPKKPVLLNSLNLPSIFMNKSGIYVKLPCTGGSSNVKIMSDRHYELFVNEKGINVKGHAESVMC